MGNRWLRVWGFPGGLLSFVVNQLTFPVMTAKRVYYLFISAVMYKTKFYYNSDVWHTVMILYVICQRVCVIDSWAHTSFVYSILSFKLGVTVRPHTRLSNMNIIFYSFYSIIWITCSSNLTYTKKSLKNNKLIKYSKRIHQYTKA